MELMMNRRGSKRSAHRAILVALLQAFLVSISFSSFCITVASAAEAKLPALPSDAELKKLIVGSWRIDHPSFQSASRRSYETYLEDCTFKHFDEVQEGSARAKVLFKLSGSWSVENGYLVRKVTVANISAALGHVSRGKLEFATQDRFGMRELGSLRIRQRAQLPAELAFGAPEVPKLLTVKEAAQVLRYVVKPEYSLEARRMRASGTGIFELRFDYETGQLKAIDIVESTGSRVLDHDAIDGLKEWKAKPHTIHFMRIAIEFTI